MEASQSKRGGQRTTIYFAHPYCSYGRGSIEHLNGMIRWFIPKGSNIAGNHRKANHERTAMAVRYPTTQPGWAKCRECHRQGSVTPFTHLTSAFTGAFVSLLAAIRAWAFSVLPNKVRGFGLRIPC